MLGGRAEDAVSAACALEMIHTYSLIHDDLPAMDNDVLRRGKPTTHVAFGHAMGVLAGDALLNYAFETIGSICDDPHVFEGGYAARVIKAFRTFADKAGYSGMIGGQVLDTTEKYSESMDIKGFDELDGFRDKISDIGKIKYTLRVNELKTSQLLRQLLCREQYLAERMKVKLNSWRRPAEHWALHSR